MGQSFRCCVLPDGTQAIEVEHKFAVCGETQASYEYRLLSTKKIINKQKYKTDYWGKIEGVKDAEFSIFD